ncbi:MAG TPA: hypothetical protein VFZ27_01215 [Terriglobia bacterium]|nr:hypothetical protein [Terriglobia bacterium]
MESEIHVHVRGRDVPTGYRLVRAVVRLGLRIFFPRLRVLGLERIERRAPAVLVITHPRTLPVALLLISALDRQVHCMVPSGELHGFFRKLVARALEIQAFDCTGEEQNLWLNSCLGVLANRGTIALFAPRHPRNRRHRRAVVDFSVRLTVEAILQSKSQVQPGIYPVHWLLGTARRAAEPLMCIEFPLWARDFLPKVGEGVAEASEHLAEAVQSATAANVFGLAAPELEHFSRELEELSRQHLRQQWSQRPDWQQRAEELELSDLARKWIVDQNHTDPARLVELRESLDAYREAHRQSALGALMVEASGAWQSSPRRVAAAWVETVLGLPAALYGLINHLPALAILSITGLFRSSPKKDPKVVWLQRIFAVLGSYTLQIFLVNFWWGRAVAGGYALTLPVSGTYLWRYRWLIRHRVHVLISKALRSVRLSRVARERENILRRFGREIERSAQSSSVRNVESQGVAE